jgi:hypothetical protein
MTLDQSFYSRWSSLTIKNSPHAVKAVSKVDLDRIEWLNTRINIKRTSKKDKRKYKKEVASIKNKYK